ncbi:MAG: CocE/NonD family hydrolase, partial [Candidatus Hodarchaeota archaeon]
MGYNSLGQAGARGRQLLIIGPFTHGFPGEGKHEQVIFPTKSISAFDLYLKWEQKLFSHIFHGREFDWNENRVAYYMMGEMNDSSEGVNDYRYAKDWPIEPYVNDSWYLTANMGLSKDSPGLINTNVSFIFDPTNPVPTLGGTNLMIPSGPYDQSSIEKRTDVLIFETSRLSEKIEAIGNMFARFWVMSNCSNTDFTVKITDVYPDGKSMLVSDGIINAIKRDGYDKDAAPLNTAGPIPLTIDLWSTAYQFNIGHRIRIAISSSNYPRFAINPNTGAPQEIYSYQYLDRFIANNTILIGPDFP